MTDLGRDQLLNLDRQLFLARYWQREPLLIKNAIVDFRTPISSHELAGLALEDAVESRLVEHCDSSWRLLHGPFTESDFLRKSPWTLLVQAVDHYIPEVAALRKLMDFIPQWRVDDVMVSYAVAGGSVGPHYDNYDVFLLQGEGSRRWQLGQFCDETSALVPHESLRILCDFVPREEYLLGPGDMLYVPPGVAHWGVAQAECTTISIGFRAPRIQDMLSRWVDELLQEMQPDQFYRDDQRAPVTRAGEISPADLSRAKTQLQTAMNRFRDTRWFGELVTEPRDPPSYDGEEIASAHALLKAGVKVVELRTYSKVAWQEETEDIVVFANGQSRPFNVSILPSLLTLCQNWRLDAADLTEALADLETVRLLAYLMENGVVDVQ